MAAVQPLMEADLRSRAAGGAGQAGPSWTRHHTLCQYRTPCATMRYASTAHRVPPYAMPVPHTIRSREEAEAEREEERESDRLLGARYAMSVPHIATAHREAPYASSVPHIAMSVPHSAQHHTLAQYRTLLYQYHTICYVSTAHRVAPNACSVPPIAMPVPHIAQRRRSTIR
eukprot:2022265-Rhodomonas_salina.1